MWKQYLKCPWPKCLCRLAAFLVLCGPRPLHSHSPLCLVCLGCLRTDSRVKVPSPLGICCLHSTLGFYCLPARWCDFSPRPLVACFPCFSRLLTCLQQASTSPLPSLSLCLVVLRERLQVVEPREHRLWFLVALAWKHCWGLSSPPFPRELSRARRNAEGTRLPVITHTWSLPDPRPVCHSSLVVLLLLLRHHLCHAAHFGRLLLTGTCTVLGDQIQVPIHLIGLFPSSPGACVLLLLIGLIRECTGACTDKHNNTCKESHKVKHNQEMIQTHKPIHIYWT